MAHAYVPSVPGRTEAEAWRAQRARVPRVLPGTAAGVRPEQQGSQLLDATARDAAGTDVGSVHMTLAIPPVDNIAWQGDGVTPKIMNDLSAPSSSPAAPSCSAWSPSSS